MTSPVLFSTGASPTASGSRNLVEFKAGKMEMKEEKRVIPINRKGLVYLRQSQEDNLMHFCWKDRQTGVVEDDLILFPEDCEFRHVEECMTGRVYVLKMKSSDKRMFFWMQEPKRDHDEEYCKKINDLLNNPPRAGSEMGGPSDRDITSLFGNMTQDQVAQFLSSNGVSLASLLSSAPGRSPSSNSGVSASSTASTTNSAPTSAAAASAAALNGGRMSSSNMNDLRAILSGALMDGADDDANAIMSAAAMAAAQRGEAGSSQNREQQPPLIDLSTAVNSESLAYLLNDENFLRQLEGHLPPITQQSSNQQQQPLSDDELRKQFGDTVRSSQFRSSLSQFCVALQSAQLGPLMSQFGLNQACVEAANLGNLEAFVRALDAQMKSSTSDQQPPPQHGESEDKE